jgi:hypothetical protein
MLMRSLVRSLRFDQDCRAELVAIRNAARLTELANRSHLTLPIALRCLESLPDPAPFARALDANRIRHRKAVAVTLEIHDSLNSLGLPFVFLKGLTQWPYYSTSSETRPQYDVDLFAPGDAISQAWQAIRNLGYEPLPHTERLPTDHLPSLLRRTSWQWRGDYFDPDMPFLVELHHRFWDPETEGFPVARTDFWARRQLRDAGGILLPSLNLGDSLTYSACHALRHLLRGDLRLYHIYEVAHFLHHSSGDHAFWGSCLTPGTAPAIPEGIIFRLAREWFGCTLHPRAAECIAALPEQIDRWFRLFAWAPVDSCEYPNKNELFLHLALLEGAAARRRVIQRRLFPAQAPRMLLDHAADQKSSALLRRSWLFVQRAWHHTRASASMFGPAMRWFAASSTRQHTSS